MESRLSTEGNLGGLDSSSRVDSSEEDPEQKTKTKTTPHRHIKVYTHSYTHRANAVILVVID